MDYYQRQRMANFKATLEGQRQRRLEMIERYSDWHDRQWLESMNYAELVAAKNAGHLDRPTISQIGEQP